MGNFNLLQDIVDSVYEKHLSNTEGEVASYIPELAHADPEPFGIALVTIDGGVITAGNVGKKFSIQSISKPFVYGMALETFGEEYVSEHVSSEPSGNAFNSLALHPIKEVPFNAMVNSGAISMSSLIYDKYKEDGETKILETFSKLANGNLEVDHQVYNSEINTADKNKALIYLMQSMGIIHGDAEKKLELYTKQCSITLNALELATMGATLANVGKNPFTNDSVYNPFTVRKILSVMFTCGMYNSAGQWAVDVGIPAKSGVSGGVMAVVNRQIGIGIFSPRLDSHGNSVRAINACVNLAEELGLHAFEFSNQGSSILDIYIK